MFSKPLLIKLFNEYSENRNFLKDYSWLPTYQLSKAIQALMEMEEMSLKHEARFCVHQEKGKKNV